MRDWVELINFPTGSIYWAFSTAPFIWQMLSILTGLNLKITRFVFCSLAIISFIIYIICIFNSTRCDALIVALRPGPTQNFHNNKKFCHLYHAFLRTFWLGWLWYVISIYHSMKLTALGCVPWVSVICWALVKWLQNVFLAIIK